MDDQDQHRTRTLAMTRESLSEYLEEQIVSGRLPPATQLPSERQLAERFGVSRAMVREALRSLIERHLVEVVPGRGAFVQQTRTSDVAHRFDALFRRRQVTPRHMVEARTALECTAAALAAERATPGDVEEMANALAQFDRASGLLDQVRADLAYHLAIAHAARNPVVETMFEAIIGLAVELMLRSLADPEVTRTALPYHRAIYEAIRDHDPERARAAMAGHLSVAASLYGEDFDRSLETVTQRELARVLAPTMTLDDLIEAAVPDLDGAMPDPRSRP
ncbi:MAG: FadR/GntR family transcriptional regulator [Thermomicrobiales bacterium]